MTVKDVAGRLYRGARHALAGTVFCKICGAVALEKFRLPHSKLTGHEIPAEPDDCPYYECTACQFCFSVHLDKQQDHTGIYDDDYWENQDAGWYGRTSEGLRMVMLANQLARKPPDELEVLDFGCGMGGFVHLCRSSFAIKAWGTDINKPKFALEYFLPKVDRTFDIVFAVEVIEHLTDPVGTITYIKSLLKPGGVFAFQTGHYHPPETGRDWWYVGPANGHISLYSRPALDSLYEQLGGKRRLFWNDYAGVQAWRFDE
jgi:SAM-dependent methyltransferase